MRLKIDKDSFELDAKICNELGKAKGLMFRRREKASALIFDFSPKTRLAIHSLFVFFPFLAIWLDDRNRVIEIKRVEPFVFSVSPEKVFSRLIEIPENEKYKWVIARILSRNAVDKKV